MRYGTKMKYNTYIFAGFLKSRQTEEMAQSVGKVLATQVWRPEFDPPVPVKTILHSSVGLYKPNTRERETGGSVGLLPSQSSHIGELQVQWELNLKIEELNSSTILQRLTAKSGKRNSQQQLSWLSQQNTNPKVRLGMPLLSPAGCEHNH